MRFGYVMSETVPYRRGVCLAVVGTAPYAFQWIFGHSWKDGYLKVPGW